MGTLYLVRHGQSEANVDKNVYRTKPDHAIALTPLGLNQANEAGTAVAKALFLAGFNVGDAENLIDGDGQEVSTSPMTKSSSFASVPR